ncbi:DUF1343 domain-containing protein [soil metagenome]
MLLVLAVFLTACADVPNTQPLAVEELVRSDERPVVSTGAQVLVDTDFAALRALAPRRPVRVGLVTNHTATVTTADGGPSHLIDRLHAADDIELAALFGPEHGLRGTAEAGEMVDSGLDSNTGVRIWSLYGSTRRPPAAALLNLDVLVFDMQDVGARFYTYVSTMGYAMQAASEAGLPFVVLDRPNPIGGNRMAGFLMESPYESFVGLYPVPQQHGLTAGELARMIVGEGWLTGLANLPLHIVELQGWNRAMLFPETGIPFNPPSPNIPDFETALVYAGMGLVEGVTASEGRGTRTPFVLVGAPWVDGEALAASLNEAGLPGARFEGATFTPESIRGMASEPKHLGRRLGGVRVHVEDAAAYEPIRVALHVIAGMYRQAPTAERRSYFNRRWMAQLAGSDRLRTSIEAGMTPDAVTRLWERDMASFQYRRAAYLLYD